MVVVVDFTDPIEIPPFASLDVFEEGGGHRFLLRPVVAESYSLLDQRVVEREFVAISSPPPEVYT